MCVFMEVVTLFGFALLSDNHGTDFMDSAASFSFLTKLELVLDIFVIWLALESFFW